MTDYRTLSAFEQVELQKQLAAVTAERDKLKAEREQMEKQEPIPSYWDCGCGWHNSLEFATCAACSRTPNEGNAVWRYKKEPASVPDGKVLVPVEPTELMIYEGREALDYGAIAVYKAMLKAAQGE